MWRWPLMNPLALPGDQPVFVPGDEDVSTGKPSAAPARSLRRLAGAAALGAIGGGLFGVAVIVAVARQDDGSSSMALPAPNENVVYAYEAAAAQPLSGAAKGVSVLVFTLEGDRGGHLTVVLTPERVSSGGAPGLSFVTKVSAPDSRPVEGATVRTETLILPWMERSQAVATTGADGRAVFRHEDLTLAGSYRFRVIDVVVGGETFRTSEEEAITVPIPGAS